MPQVEIHTFPPNEEIFKETCEHVALKLIGSDYCRIGIERIHTTKKPRVAIFQDGKGDLTIEVDHKRIYDERE